YQQLGRSCSYRESLKVLESDIQHANDLAAAIPKAKGGTRLQMKLVYNKLAPVFLYFLQWIDCSCTCFLPRYFNLFHVLIYKAQIFVVVVLSLQVYTDDGRPKISAHGRKASIKEFYAVILPSLHQLHYDLVELDSSFSSSSSDEENRSGKKKKKKKQPHRENTTPSPKKGSESSSAGRDDECGICLEPCTKMVMPNCCHAMCINCYRDW
ncbi:hypothetical protein M569_07776, partial [Genlisea aurea]